MDTVSTSEYFEARQEELLQEINEIKRAVKTEKDLDEIATYHSCLAALYSKLFVVETALGDLIQGGKG